MEECCSKVYETSPTSMSPISYCASITMIDYVTGIENAILTDVHTAITEKLHAHPRKSLDTFSIFWYLKLKIQNAIKELARKRLNCCT